MDCVKEDMARKGVNLEMTSDRVEWMNWFIMVWVY